MILRLIDFKAILLNCYLCIVFAELAAGSWGIWAVVHCGPLRLSASATGVFNWRGKCLITFAHQAPPRQSRAGTLGSGLWARRWARVCLTTHFGRSAGPYWKKTNLGAGIVSYRQDLNNGPATAPAPNWTPKLHSCVH